LLFKFSHFYSYRIYGPTFLTLGTKARDIPKDVRSDQLVLILKRQCK
jgi:hypothetical protein